MKSAPELFRAIPIELPPNCSSARPTGINDKNVVVGVLSGNGPKAFVWDGKKTTVLSPNSMANANAINNAGGIVGCIVKDEYEFTAAQWKNSRENRFLSKRGRSEAFAVNDSGTIGGIFSAENRHICGFLLLRDGNFHAIEPKNAETVSFTGLNRSNHASLHLSSGVNGIYRAAIFGPQGIGELRPIKSNLNSITTGINDKDDVVGTCYDRGGQSIPTLWRKGVSQRVPIPRNMNGWCSGINNAGMIVGDVPSRSGYLSEGFTVIDGRFFYLSDVNDRKIQVHSCTKPNEKGNFAVSGQIGQQIVAYLFVRV